MGGGETEDLICTLHRHRPGTSSNRGGRLRSPRFTRARPSEKRLADPLRGVGCSGATSCGYGVVSEFVLIRNGQSNANARPRSELVRDGALEVHAVAGVRPVDAGAQVPVPFAQAQIQRPEYPVRLASSPVRRGVRAPRSEDHTRLPKTFFRKEHVYILPTSCPGVTRTRFLWRLRQSSQTYKCQVADSRAVRGSTGWKCTSATPPDGSPSRRDLKK